MTADAYVPGTATAEYLAQTGERPPAHWKAPAPKPAHPRGAYLTLDVPAMLDQDMPDLSAGRCMPWHSPLPPRAWTSIAATEERTAAQALCHACPVLDACRDWAADKPRGHFYGVVAGRVWLPKYGVRRDDDE